MLFFRCGYLFYYSSEMNITMTEHITWLPEYVLHESFFKSHEKQSNSNSWKRGFCALSKLVYFENLAFSTGRVFHGGAEIILVLASLFDIRFFTQREFDSMLCLSLTYKQSVGTKVWACKEKSLKGEHFQRLRLALFKLIRRRRKQQQ